MTLTVRLATPADYDAVARFTVDAYRDDGQLATPTGYEQVLADVETRAKESDLLVAEDEHGRVLGAVAYVLPGSRYAELSREGEAEFRMLAVSPKAQPTSPRPSSNAATGRCRKPWIAPLPRVGQTIAFCRLSRFVKNDN